MAYEGTLHDHDFLIEKVNDGSNVGENYSLFVDAKSSECDDHEYN